MKVYYTVFLAALIAVCFGDLVADDDSEEQQVMLVSGLMWAAVQNYGKDIDLSTQDKYEEGSSKTYSKLVKTVDSEVLKDHTIVALDNLLKVYDTSDTESQELDDFMEKIFKTPVMLILREYLQNQTTIEDADELKTEFKRIWFDSYVYDDMAGNKTSGFNHVYMGELNDTGVHGFHNWIRYYNEEDADKLAYKGWIEKTTMDGKMPLLSVRFEWNDEIKPVSTISFGTKPEYELAVFTLCYYKLPGEKCYVAMGDDVVNIVTEVADVDDKEYIRTAYFTLLDASGSSNSIRPDIIFSIILSFLLSWRNFAL